MKKTLVILAAACAAAAIGASAQAPRAGESFKARTMERYCERLRESPEAYAQFVNRLQAVHGYTHHDFVPSEPGAPVKADCRVRPARILAEAAPTPGGSVDARGIATLR